MPFPRHTEPRGTSYFFSAPGAETDRAAVGGSSAAALLLKFEVWSLEFLLNPAAFRERAWRPRHTGRWVPAAAPPAANVWPPRCSPASRRPAPGDSAKQGWTVPAGRLRAK